MDGKGKRSLPTKEKRRREANISCKVWVFKKKNWRGGLKLQVVEVKHFEGRLVDKWVLAEFGAQNGKRLRDGQKKNNGYIAKSIESVTQCERGAEIILW